MIFLSELLSISLSLKRFTLPNRSIRVIPITSEFQIKHQISGLPEQFKH